MIKTYPNGNEFYNDNKDFLLTNKYVEPFFRLDSPQLVEVNKHEYALSASDDSNHHLVVLKKEPYNLMLFGDIELVEELFTFIFDKGYEIKDYLCPTDLGDEIVKYLNKHGYNSHLHIGMDFMECHDKCMPSSNIVETAKEEDLDEIVANTEQFVIDCGLTDKVNVEHIKAHIHEFRIIRVDGHIVSMAKGNKDFMEESQKIAYVFTKKEYRGKGYSKQVVNYILNEIIDSGRYATLNVDQKNPISYHLYTSLGFKKIFSQGIYKI